MTLEQIIERYNKEAQSASDYATSDESSHAEYCASFGYGDASTHEVIENLSRDFDSSTIDALKAYAKTHKRGEVFELIGNASELTFIPNIHCRHGEAFSVGLGEIEEQPSDELLEAYEALSPEDQQKVRKSVECYISDSSCKGWMYLNHDYERFGMITDEDKLREALGLTAEIGA